ncbi:MAG TPA: hypothetical protein VF510_23415 [Ktedonobacterales bacterium]
MTWLTWRQHRSVVTVALILLVGMALFITIIGWQMRHDAQSLASSACAHPGGCPDILAAQTDTITVFHNVTLMLLFVPVLIGVFIGAPLIAREYEQQTYKTAWTQSITRSRWLGAQVALLFAGTLVMSGILSALVAWADYGTLDQRYTLWAFDLSAIVPVSYATFALALGLAAGALLQRTLPAIGITLAGYLAIRLPILSSLRSHYMSPLTAIGDLVDPQNWQPSAPNGNTDWILEQGFVQGGHRYPSGIKIPSYCEFSPGQSAMQLNACLQAHGWSAYTIYQPADRFWMFQGIESVIFFGLTAALVALTIWWVRRRLV